MAGANIAAVGKSRRAPYIKLTSTLPSSSFRVMSIIVEHLHKVNNHLNNAHHPTTASQSNSSNMSPKTFFDLPGEVRNKIYTEYAKSITKYIFCAADDQDDWRVVVYDGGADDTIVYKHSALLAVSRQIREESVNFLATHAPVFIYKTPNFFSDWPEIQKCIPDLVQTSMQEVILYLDMTMHVRNSSYEEQWAELIRPFLRSLPNLRHIKVHDDRFTFHTIEYGMAMLEADRRELQGPQTCRDGGIWADQVCY